MGRIGIKLPNFCLNRIRPLVRVRSSPYNGVNLTSRADQEKREVEKGDSGGVSRVGEVNGRKIMIVVDSTTEAKNAVQWALSHTVQNNDMIILLHITKSSNREDKIIGQAVTNPEVPEFLTRIKSICKLNKPEVDVEIAVVRGKEKGPAIVEEAKRREVVLLVLGQKKRSVTWRLMVMWAGNGAPAGGLAEYCVRNATCMAIAVRRKSNKLGGYLITTKRQKDFWLLA